MKSAIRAVISGTSVVFGGFVASAHAQEILWHRDAEEVYTSFGLAIVISSDRSGDGVSDVLVGYPGRACNTWGGMLYLLSGKDGSTVFEICGGDVNGDGGFGSAVADLPDLNHDGVPEFIVGASTYDYNHSYDGAAFVYSGADLQLMTSFFGEDGNNLFGSVVSSVADIDNDGLDDFLVSAPSFSWFYPYGAGRTYIYSSASYALLRTQTGEKDYDLFGLRAGRIADWDGDGIDDYVIGSRLTKTTDYGQAELFSGATGKLLHRWEGDHDSGFGLTIRCDDLDGDGIEDLLITDSGLASEAGYVHAYSGADGSALFTLRGDRVDDKFGISIADVGDMTGDGVREFLVGAGYDDAAGTDAGYARLFSGKTARPLYTFFPVDDQILFGVSVSGGADFNGDALPDFLIRASQTPKVKGKRMGGRVTAYAGNDLFLQADLRAPLPGDTITIATRGGESGALTLLALVDVSGTALFQPLYLSTLDANGESELVATIPSAASGLDFTLIAFAQKQAGGRGVIDSWAETIAVQ